MTSVFERVFKNFKKSSWKEGKTAKGNRKFSIVWAGVWLNVVIKYNNELFITYGKDEILNTLIWNDDDKDNILHQITQLLINNPLENKPVKKNNICLSCKKPIVAFGTYRKNGGKRKDWDGRSVHMKCYPEWKRMMHYKNLEEYKEEKEMERLNEEFEKLLAE